ncbi:DUF2213 domain-containing protein [Acinetobacter sp.]|uniref:DUF2213 domain-containing protein n=1 Tax=Acinetobacter sp. TaxID=472 RepID=UPI00388DC544
MFKKKPKAQHSATQDRSNIYTTGQIGRTRETTPEGYLLCRDVPIARIGTLMYGDGEVPVTADNTGLILIQRGEDDLFDPKTIASFEGKAVTDDHPDDWVNPSNWKALAVGTAQSVRRGEGIDTDFLMADLLITDQDAIDKVMGGKVEISLGYDADYIEISPGKGVQRNIFGNHVALVDKGRCGSRCSIGDSFMPKPNKGWLDSLRKAKRTIDEALEKAKNTEDEDPEETEDDDDEQDGKTSDAVNRQLLKTLKTMDARLAALEKKTKDSDKSETKDDDDESETKDSDDDSEKTEDDILEAEPAGKIVTGVTHTGDSLKDVLVRAEVLAPGMKMPPTIDSANNGQAVITAKRQALKAAMLTTDGQKVVSPFLGTHTDIDTLPTHTLDAAFIGASELIKQHNNAKGVRTGISTKDFGRSAPTIDQINQQNREFWGKK